ncbi:Transcription factor [Dirofilaria immitis]
MKSDSSTVIDSSDSNFFVSKAEIERRRRARMNASLDQLKMFHLIRSPTIESKMEKIEILDLTIKYLQSIDSDQRKGRDSVVWTVIRSIDLISYRRSFQYYAEQVVLAKRNSVKSRKDGIFRIQEWISGSTEVFDQSFKSMNWLRPVYGNNVKGRKQTSSINTSETNLPEVRRQSTSFLPQSHSTPIFHPKTIPPLFESPEKDSCSTSTTVVKTDLTRRYMSWNHKNIIIQEE